MTEKYPILYWILRIIGLLLAGFSFLLEEFLGEFDIYLAIVFILLLGIPHGATDFKIFKELKNPISERGMGFFYSFYLGLMALYSLVWWLFPSIALGLFILVSLYHFGQSNWVYLNDKKFLLYLSWGGFVLLTPIIIHWEKAEEIILSMTSLETFLVNELDFPIIIWLMVAINFAWIIYLWSKKELTLRQTIDELLNLAVLGLVFHFTPLWIGFVYYFVGFHSLTSIGDQIEFFKKNQPGYNWKKYIQTTAPLTIISILGLWGLVYLWGSFQWTNSIGLLFIFISVVTMPHMIIMELLYNE